MDNISKDTKMSHTVEVKVIELPFSGSNKEEILKIISAELEKYPEMHSVNGRLSGFVKSKPVNCLVEQESVETINNNNLLYIRTDCLKIANGNIEKAQEYFDWITKPTINLEDFKTIENELKRLRLHEATTVGLWAIDRNPKKVSYKWIKREAFKIKKLDTYS